MAKRTWSVERIEEIQRYITEGLSDRQVARTLRCRRARVREIRELGRDAVPAFAALPVDTTPPAWADSVEWSTVIDEIDRGFEIKRIWEERAQSATSYSNFWKYLSRRYAWLLKRSVTLREFDPGTYAEVDWAGDKIPWWDVRGRRHEAHLFMGILCHSQLIFAWASSDERKSNWLHGHQKMYAFFGGVPRVTVPDNLKTGVKKPHPYDPDLNPAYMELARHYATAVVPARVRRPRDKALVENAVGIILRLFHWMYRGHRFHSLTEINEALTLVVRRVNDKHHTRFKMSRRERFEQRERDHLKPLPQTPFEDVEWKQATVHPDCTVSVDSALYSVPHIHRGKTVRVKLTAHQVEVFVGWDRVALHARDKNKSGIRVIDPSHLPVNSQAYREATPQNILSQARFLSDELHTLIESLFEQDALGHLRRAQGLVRHAREEIHRYGRAGAEARIAEATTQMQRFGRIQVRFFSDTLQRLRRTQTLMASGAAAGEIQRLPGNPMLRGIGEPGHAGEPFSLQKERTIGHEHDPSEASDAGVEAPRHG